MLSFEDFRAWMDQYGKVCQDQDADAAAALFAQNARYYETPFDAPLVGREAIYSYWCEATRAIRNVEFSYLILTVRGNLGLALWRGSFTNVSSGKRVILDGVFLAEFDGQRKCRKFREWWHRLETAQADCDQIVQEWKHSGENHSENEPRI